MTKLDFHHFQVRHFNNFFEQSWCHCWVGATPASRSNCLQTRRIHHQVKYRRLNANTCIVAAILFSGHPYIGRHYRASLILGFGSTCYSAAMLPFITDQIVGATSDELSAVIRWYYWAQSLCSGLSTIVVYFCKESNLENVYVGSSLIFAIPLAVISSSFMWAVLQWHQ